MIIKHITKGPWGDKQKTATTWYEPFTDLEIIQKAVNFALSYQVTGVCTPGDIRVLPLVIQACENYRELTHEQMEEMIELGKQYEPLFS